MPSKKRKQDSDKSVSKNHTAASRAQLFDRPHPLEILVVTVMQVGDLERTMFGGLMCCSHESDITITLETPDIIGTRDNANCCVIIPSPRKFPIKVPIGSAKMVDRVAEDPVRDLDECSQHFQSILQTRFLSYSILFECFYFETEFTLAQRLSRYPVKRSAV